MRQIAAGLSNPSGLTLHSDNDAPMKGSTLLATLEKLGVMPSFSRPSVSNDSPFSEALCRTLKYRPAFPEGPFESIEVARQWVERFVAWYNGEHRHSAIKFVTPDERHFGREAQILSQRARVYEIARANHPERWSRHTRNWTPAGPVRIGPSPEYAPKEQMINLAA